MVVMLSGEFAKLIWISILFALPIAYLLPSNWLSDFAYRIPLQKRCFLGAGLTAILGPMLTVSNQAMSAASRSPIKSLKEV